MFVIIIYRNLQSAFTSTDMPSNLVNNIKLHDNLHYELKSQCKRKLDIKRLKSH